MRPILLATALIATPTLAAPDYQAAIERDYEASLGNLFTQFHQNPELSFREVNTAARMAKELRAIPGIVVTEKVGQTGVVGVLRNGTGKTVLVRADMDGLPVQETSGLPYASKARQVGSDGVESPVMHACGHDTHITGMIATARRLAAMKDRWRGTVVFVVQPAEEGLGGAKAMIADGLYSRFPKPDYALALHVAAELPTGKVSASESTQYSSSDAINIRVNGVATHGASPQLGKDPVYIAAQMILAFQGIVGREKGPLQPGVITVGAVQAGSRHNIISDHADLQVTVRSNEPAVRDQLVSAIERTAKGIAMANGAPEPVMKIVGNTPVTKNDGALARRLNAVMRTTLGDAAVVPFEQRSMGAEDFAYFVGPNQLVPGYYFAVGGTPQSAFDAAKAGGAPVAGHHSGLFKVDPRAAIVTGATAMTAAVLDLLQPRTTASGL
jgi:amidohydrolase